MCVFLLFLTCVDKNLLIELIVIRQTLNPIANIHNQSPPRRLLAAISV